MEVGHKARENMIFMNDKEILLPPNLYKLCRCFIPWVRISLLEHPRLMKENKTKNIFVSFSALVTTQKGYEHV